MGGVYMPYFHPYTEPVKNHPNGTPVAVVVNFSSDGRFKPEIFRYISSDQSEHTIKINRIKSYTDYFDRTAFTCIIQQGRLEKEIILDYLINERIWVLRE